MEFHSYLLNGGVVEFNQLADYILHLLSEGEFELLDELYNCDRLIDIIIDNYLTAVLLDTLAFENILHESTVVRLLAEDYVLEDIVLAKASEKIKKAKGDK